MNEVELQLRGLVQKLAGVDDAYAAVRERLPRLCPELVPSPLWGLSLAGLAGLTRYNIDALARLVPHLPEVAEELERAWRSLPRERCEVCGSTGRLQVDEVWVYRVGEGCGVAELTGLRVLCWKCHLAKHIGYASVRRQTQQALEHLASVNGVSLEEAREVSREVGRIWGYLSTIKKWKIIIKPLPGFDSNLLAKAEGILNSLHGKNITMFEGRLHRSGSNRRDVLKREVEETRRSLEVLEREGFKGLLDYARAALGPHRVRVLEREFKVALHLLLHAGEAKEVREVEEAAKRIDDPEVVRARIKALREGGISTSWFTGKWLFHLPARQALEVFIRVTDYLEGAGLLYFAETSLGGGRSTLAFYVPSFLAFNLVAEVLEAIRSTAAVERAFFEPDIFIEGGIRSTKAGTAHSGLKPYIYVLQSLHQSYTLDTFLKSS